MLHICHFFVVNIYFSAKFYKKWLFVIEIMLVYITYIEPTITVFRKNGGEFLVGIGENGVIVAMGGLNLLEEGKAEIKRLRVHPSYQKRGYGQQILSHLEQKAKDLGIKHLILDTLSNQLDAQKLFKKNGYQQNGSAIIDDFNVILYRKALA